MKLTLEKLYILFIAFVFLSCSSISTNQQAPSKTFEEIRNESFGTEDKEKCGYHNYNDSRIFVKAGQTQVMFNRPKNFEVFQATYQKNGSEYPDQCLIRADDGKHIVLFLLGDAFTPSHFQKVIEVTQINSAKNKRQWKKWVYLGNSDFRKRRSDIAIPTSSSHDTKTCLYETKVDQLWFSVETYCKVLDPRDTILNSFEKVIN